MNTERLLLKSSLQTRKRPAFLQTAMGRTFSSTIFWLRFPQQLRGTQDDDKTSAFELSRRQGA